MSHPPDRTSPRTPQAQHAPPASPFGVGGEYGAPFLRTLPPPAVPVRAGDLPSVSVVVLNYNGLKHLQTCFESLLALDYPRDRLELIMVDNGSSDGSVQFMRERFPTVRVLETGANLGFAAGNNFGAERATGQYVAFLNNDTRVDPGWLKALVGALAQEHQKHEAHGTDAGVVCASSLMLDWWGERIDFQAGGLNFHGFGFQPSYGLPVKGQHIGPRHLLFACGGSMLIQRDVFLAVGGFDPDYFAFFEDVDLGWRLWVLGYRVVLAPDAITYHRHHGTAGQIPSHRVQVLYERNALATIYKNYEQANLDRILPAALLLLGQRAVRFMELSGVDMGDYDMADSRRSIEDTDNVHRNAVADLLAVNEFMDSVDRLNPKRRWIQAHRKRPDSELFELFGQPGRVHLLNHAVDAPYAAAHYTLMREFGIERLWQDLPKEVLVVSPDVLPVGDIPASGSGIRAWALGKGLESRGHRVRFTMPAAAVAGREHSVPPEYVHGAWTPENLQALIDSLVPDVVVSCGWPNLTWLKRANLPVALDLTGPHLLERAYQGYMDQQTNAAEKLEALRHADFYTCIGERQKYYFIGWLAQAGVDVERIPELLHVVPYSLDPDQPEHIWPRDWSSEQVRFIYGGIFLPWQNPAPALLTVASALEEAGRGVLEIIGGRHPFHAVDTASFGPLVDRLAKLPRVSVSDLLPHDRLVERYRRAHVAVDVMVPNAERELAFPSRTIHYMWCGLPVIHASYSEVARHIQEYEAGWVVSHDNPHALREVVLSILDDPNEAARRGHNAQRLVRDRFSWDRTIQALDRFVREPHIRGERAARPPRPSMPVRPQGYVIPVGQNGKDGRWIPSPEKLRVKRQGIVSQVAARSAELLRSLAPVKGSRARPVLVGGQKRFALPELTAGHSHGQRFLCPHPGLSGIRVAVNTFGRRNTSRLVLHLRASPAARSDLYTLEVPAHTLRDGDMLAFRFPPMADSEGRWLYFVAESPDGVPGDAVSLWATTQAGPTPARRYEDGLPAGGFLVMELEFDKGEEGRGAG